MLSLPDTQCGGKYPVILSHGTLRQNRHERVHGFPLTQDGIRTVREDEFFSVHARDTDDTPPGR